MFRFGTHLFRKVTIIGVGLIGGSVGLAIKKHRLAREVVGISRQPSSLQQALKVGAIDRSAQDVKKAVEGADLVILGTPVKTTIELFAEIGPSLRHGCIVTDVGSTKTEVVEAALKILPPHSYFVGAHPMAGSEKKGAAFASAQLFEKTLCIITPAEKTHPKAVDKVKRLWEKLGASIKILSPSDHDKILAYVSHVPHLLAYALMEIIPEESISFASQGLKDTTRIAASDPEMWSHICKTNPTHITQVLDEVVKILSLYRKAIVTHHAETLFEHFRKSKQKRDALG